MKELAARLTEQIYAIIQQGGSNQANEVQKLIENQLEQIYEMGFDDGMEY